MNYRMRMCLAHDKPQFLFCFTCGQPIVKEGEEDEDGEQMWTCAALNFHLKIWTTPHPGDGDTDCPQEMEFI